MRKRYLINTETISLSSEFDEYGNENTRVIEGANMFLVAATPNEIIDYTFKFYGFSLNGALTGAKEILDGAYCLPVVIDVKDGIVLFPCGAFRQKDSVWIANNHIIDIEKLGNETIIHTSYGHCLIVPMSAAQVHKKRGQAAILHSTLQHRTSRKMLFLYERESGFILRKKKGELNITKINDKEEE